MYHLPNSITLLSFVYQCDVVEPNLRKQFSLDQDLFLQLFIVTLL